MSEEVKVYKFNEYILSYDKSERDRSCLTISKTQNGNIYVMSELLDVSADVVSMILDSLQTTVNYCKQENQKYKEVIDKMNKLLQQEQDAMTTKFHYDIVGLINALLDILKEVSK